MHVIDTTELYEKTAVLLKQLIARDLTLALAESCTGGLLAHAITANGGASACFLGGVVSYANSAKMAMLGVKAETLLREGAVSEAVVREMADGVRTRLGTDWAIATSGIAGPTGETPDKPIGTVWVAWASRSETSALQGFFPDTRLNFQKRVGLFAFDTLLRRVI